MRLSVKSRLCSIRHIQQEDPLGDGLACLAMILGCEYRVLRARCGEETINWQRTQSRFLREEWFYHFGFAIQHKIPFDPILEDHRPAWPLAPWGEAHICTVDCGGGVGTHAVVLLEDGTVFDPSLTHSTQWQDYRGVGAMTALFDLTGITPSDDPLVSAFYPESC